MNTHWQPHPAHLGLCPDIQKPEGTFGQTSEGHQKATEKPSEGLGETPVGDLRGVISRAWHSASVFSSLRTFLGGSLSDFLKYRYNLVPARNTRLFTGREQIWVWKVSKWVGCFSSPMLSFRAVSRGYNVTCSDVTTKWGHWQEGMAKYPGALRSSDRDLS